MQGPNIFKYASKEFSQDIFICYLVGCAAEASGELKQCGLAFVRTLFRAGASDEILGPDGNRVYFSPYDGPCNVSDVINITSQYKITSEDRLDVYFQAKIDGRLVTFIIENKKDREADIGQLKRYLKAVIENKEEENPIKPIFFKTGYVFSDERMAVERAKYSVFEARDMKSFLDGQDVTRENEILRQYAEYMTCQIETRADAQARYEFGQDHVQWEFMLKLRDRVENAAGEWRSFIPGELSGSPPNSDWLWCGLGRDENVYNDSEPFTQYWFARYLFWRLDAGKPLRLMICLSNAGRSVEESNGMMREYRDCFARALQEGELSDGGINVENSRGDQCAVGSVETTKFQDMTASEFLDRVTRVHIRFLDMISAKVELMKRLWCEVDSALEEEIRDLPSKSEELSDVSEETIKGFKDHGLYYPFGSRAASLGVVQEEGRIFFGVYYDENKDEHRELEAALKAVLKDVPGGDKPTNEWLWWAWADGDLESYTERITQGLKPVWEAIKRAGLDR